MKIDYLMRNILLHSEQKRVTFKKVLVSLLTHLITFKLAAKWPMFATNSTGGLKNCRASSLLSFMLKSQHPIVQELRG
jgi:hypothetical protein